MKGAMIKSKNFYKAKNGRTVEMGGGKGKWGRVKEKKEHVMAP
jgi:hypothetical protein